MSLVQQAELQAKTKIDMGKKDNRSLSVYPVAPIQHTVPRTWEAKQVGLFAVVYIQLEPASNLAAQLPIETDIC
jgi:hypothetical protein